MLGALDSASRGPSGERACPTRLLLEGVASALVSVLCAAWVLRLWHADLTVPLRYAPVDDTKFYLMLVKGIVEHGSYLSNANLGAPFGQHLNDYPQGADNLSLLLVRGLSLFSANAAVVVNLFYLLTFALASFSAHLVLRSLGVGARAAGLAAVLFSLLAYHFFRGESHLLLSAYYAVPLTGYLLLETMAGGRLFARRTRRAAGPRSAAGRMRWLSGRSLATLAICVAIGSANLYYATFAVALLLAASVLLALARRWRSALVGLVLMVLVSASVLGNISPSLLYRAEHGPNRALERSASFSEGSDEAFSLRLANLLLPTPHSRIAPLGHLAASYDHTFAPGYCEACYASLGSVGTLGFLGLALCALAGLLGAAGGLLAQSRLRHAAVAVALALALASVGGLASLVEVFITADLRAWNRISVLIAFLSLLAFALLLERLLERMGPGRLARAGATAVTGAVLVLGVLDQTNDSFIPSYAATGRQWRSDQGFVAEIERRLPRRAAIFQLPYVPFPEGYPETPVGDAIATYATKYEPLRGYLHSRTLRWSYGATKGRSSDWAAQLTGQPLPYAVAAAAAGGFDGLWVDPSAFEPRKALAIAAALGRLLAQAPLRSPQGDLWFFDLRDYRARLMRSDKRASLAALRGAVLHPVGVECRSGALALFNPSSAARAITLSVRLLQAGSAGSPYSAVGSVVPDGQASDIPASATVGVRIRMALAPGRTVLRLERASLPSGALPRALYASVADDAVLRFASPSGSGRASTLVAGLTGPPCAG